MFDGERKEEFPGQCTAGGRTAGANSKRAGIVGCAVEQSSLEIKRYWLVKEFHFMVTASLLSCLQQRASGPVITVSPHLYRLYRNFYKHLNYYCRPGSSVDIATDYGLDGPGLNPRGEEIFRLSRPGLGPTEPPVKWVLGLSRG